MDDLLTFLKKDAAQYSKEALDQIDQVYADASMDAYMIWLDELQKSDNPYGINKPEKDQRGVYVIRPDNPAKAFQIEFGKFEEGSSFSEEEPNQIIRRVAKRIEQMLQEYKRYGMNVQVKYQMENPTF